MRVRSEVVIIVMGKRRRPHTYITKRALLCYYSTISRGAFNEY